MTSSPVIQNETGLQPSTGFPTDSVENIISTIKINSAAQTATNSTASQSTEGADSCKVTIQIHWPSKLRVKELDKEMSSLGKMLCRGTYKQIARAAWRCKKLQQHFLAEIAREIHKECSELCKKGVIQ